MMPFATHECRWFFSGSLDPIGQVVDRFRSAGDWRRSADLSEPAWPDDWREDRYVVLPRASDAARADLGIKLRDETPAGGTLRLEIKARTASLGGVAFAPEASGITERWVKWSYAASEMPTPLWEPFVSGELGILLRKKRLLRRLRFPTLDVSEPAPDDDEEVPVDHPFARGVEIELTRILIGEAEHWTLGFEASPQDIRIHDDLMRTAGHFFRDFGNVADLSVSRSMSYPEWLSRLSAAG